VLAAFLKMMGMPSGKPLQSRAESPVGASEKRGITLHESTDVASGRWHEKASASAARSQEVKTTAKKPATASQAKKPAAKAATKPAAKPAKAAKPAAKPASKPAAKPAPKKPVAKPVAKKPAAKPAAKSVAKPAAKKPAAKPAKAAAKPAAKSKPAAKPIKPVSKPTPKSTPKSSPKSNPKAAPKAAAKPVAKPAAKPAVKPVAKAVPQTPKASQAPAKAPAPKIATPAKTVAAPASAPVAPASKPTKAGSRVVPSYQPTAAQAPIGGHGAAKASFTMSAPVLAPPPQVVIKKDPKLANNWKSKSPEQLTDAEVIAMPDGEYMNEKQLAFFRLKLVASKNGILSNAGETTEHLREDTSIVPDPADRATIEEEHALELRTRDRERKLLKKIEQAIARIDAEEYGYCDETGEPIGVARLIARPTATLSLEAQQRRELKQKMFGD
jgi:DnaK suppressor protein